MTVYTVTKDPGTTDDEFQAYVDLLEAVGIDITNVPRTPEPGTNKRWLYVWQNRDQADRFVNELRLRTRDNSWHRYDFERLPENRGPLIPLEILEISTHGGTIYQLSQSSLIRVSEHFPNARLVGEVLRSTAIRAELEPDWNQIAVELTGLTETMIGQMGGCRFVTVRGRILHECHLEQSLPTRV